MPYHYLPCPACGEKVKSYQNPFPTVDLIIERPGGIVLIRRKNEPLGWALPGGFVDYGESLESAAARECLEETSLTVVDLQLLGCYSDPSRDTRFHTVSAVYVATCSGILAAGDDAADVRLFPLDALPEPLCFDHAKIIGDYRDRKAAGTL